MALAHKRKCHSEASTNLRGIVLVHSNFPNPSHAQDKFHGLGIPCDAGEDISVVARNSTRLLNDGRSCGSAAQQANMMLSYISWSQNSGQGRRYPAVTSTLHAATKKRRRDIWRGEHTKGSGPCLKPMVEGGGDQPLSQRIDTSQLTMKHSYVRLQ